MLLCQSGGGGGGGGVGGSAVSHAPPAWTKYWAPIRVLDLSRNNLEGIEALLVVEALAAGDGHSKSGGGEDDGGGATFRKGPPGAGARGGAAAGENRTIVYPLESLEELRLNGNELHGLPRDMHRVLPSLVRLELYGNRIGGIKAPERPLMRLKVRGGGVLLSRERRVGPPTIRGP